MKQAPFALTATGSDPGDALTYSWEQVDAGGSGFANPPYTDTGDPALTTRPIFRPYDPASSLTAQSAYTTRNGVTVPNTAKAIVGNATTVGPVSDGYLTFYPADVSQPTVASGNCTTGQILNSPFTVGLSATSGSLGQFKIFTTATTNLVVDVLCYYSNQLNDVNGTGLLFTTLTPVRLLDTRAGFAGCFTPGAPMTGGTVYTQSSIGACLSIPVTAKAVVGNATVVVPPVGGYLAFWPSNAAQPLVATSNFQTGDVLNRHFTLG